MTGPVANGTPDGFTRPVWMALLATMIGTSGQLGYALGVMNAPSEVGTVHAHFGFRSATWAICIAHQKPDERNLSSTVPDYDQ